MNTKALLVSTVVFISSFAFGTGVHVGDRDIEGESRSRSSRSSSSAETSRMIEARLRNEHAFIDRMDLRADLALAALNLVVEKARSDMSEAQRYFELAGRIAQGGLVWDKADKID